MKYNLELSVEGMEKGIKILKDYKKKLERAKIKILNRLADKFIEVAQQNVPIQTGQLAASINKTQIQKDVIEVYTDNFYSKFVEFGTGVIGNNKPHPDTSSINWKYDVNKHGEKGWKYQTPDGLWHWTKGQEAKEYWYKAYQFVDSHFMEIAEQVYREEGLI